MSSPEQTNSETSWDGKVHSYRPPPDWRERVSVDLEFHSEVAGDLDPVTFEVIRHRLWMINQAHGETVTRISGSPVMAAYDFNMTIMTEDAEVVLNAPYIQYLNAGAPVAIRYVLEQHSADPGIEEGDVYLGNDPWIGAVHQMDVLLMLPIFVDGKLFAWTSNAGHNYDLGGIVPGGWPQNAVDVYYDPVVLPPFKIIEAGKPRPDLERAYLRQSRMPDLVALDYRAQLGGVNFARDAILRLCSQFGAPTVKAAMRRILDDSQRNFAAKLERIPDSRLSRVVYLDEKLPGDRGTQRVQLNFTKRGDRLIADNEGAGPQEEGPNGFTYTGFAGGVLGLLSITMMHESLFAIGGADRQVDYEPTPGLLNCVDYPAAVAGSVLSIVSHMYSSLLMIGQMLATDPELKADIIVGIAEYPLVVLVGTDADGKPFGQGLIEDAMGSGARSFADGVNTAGPVFSPLSFLMNVEAQEQFFPIVYLYRKEGEDSGAPGRWRGGASYVTCVAPYKAESVSMVTFAGGQGISTQSSPGLMGGYPSGPAKFLIRRGTNAFDLFAEGLPAGDIRELTAAEDDLVLRGKSNGTPIGPTDVFEIQVGGGGGYGDPLLREPERVSVDVADGLASRAVAERIYGVVLDHAGQVDVAATGQRREALRQERKAWPAARQKFSRPDEGLPSTPADGQPSRAVHEYVEACDRDGHRVLACMTCGEALADVTASFKWGALVGDSPVTELARPSESTEFIDAEMIFRRYCCPGCATLISTEMTQIGEEPFDDIVFAAGL